MVSLVVLVSIEMYDYPSYLVLHATLTLIVLHNSLFTHKTPNFYT